MRSDSTETGFSPSVASLPAPPCHAKPKNYGSAYTPSATLHLYCVSKLREGVYAGLYPPLANVKSFPQLFSRFATGDLAAFLKVPAVSLEKLKALIERFPESFDVDRCEPRYFPHLAHLVGRPYDGTTVPDTQRNIIREAVPIYARKATIPAIRRSLTEIGWSGELEETFRRAFRLNSRPLLNSSKLPGLIHSLGVYRVICLNQTGGLRDALTFHHPAGTRAYFWQWFFSRVSHAEDLIALEKLIVRYILFGSIDEAFALNRTPLGRCFHLTRKQKAFSYLQLNSGTTLQPNYD